jgi:cellulose biosynthesis protein BcsQ
MSTTHWFLQAKGAVGKSLAACLLAQYLPDKSFNVRCYDADPINSTFASFAALTAAKVDLIEASDKGRRINPRRFDHLVDKSPAIRPTRTSSWTQDRAHFSP